MLILKLSKLSIKSTGQFENKSFNFYVLFLSPKCWTKHFEKATSFRYMFMWNILLEVSVQIKECESKINIDLKEKLI